MLEARGLHNRRGGLRPARVRLPRRAVVILATVAATSGAVACGGRASTDHREPTGSPVEASGGEDLPGPGPSGDARESTEPLEAALRGEPRTVAEARFDSPPAGAAFGFPRWGPKGVAWSGDRALIAWLGETTDDGSGSLGVWWSLLERGRWSEPRRLEGLDLYGWSDLRLTRDADDRAWLVACHQSVRGSRARGTSASDNLQFDPCWYGYFDGVDFSRPWEADPPFRFGFPENLPESTLPGLAALRGERALTAQHGRYAIASPTGFATTGSRSPYDPLETPTLVALGDGALLVRASGAEVTGSQYVDGVWRDPHGFDTAGLRPGALSLFSSAGGATLVAVGGAEDPSDAALLVARWQRGGWSSVETWPAQLPPRRPVNVVVDALGRPTVAWVSEPDWPDRDATTLRDLYVTRLDAAGGTARLSIEAPEKPHLLSSSDGHALVIWARPDGDSHLIEVAEFDGTSLGEPHQIARGVRLDPTDAFSSPDGSLRVITWIETEEPVQRLRAQILR